MNKVIFIIFSCLFLSCTNKKEEMKIEKIPNVEITVGNKAKIEYFEIFDSESYTDQEILSKIKKYCDLHVSENSTIEYNELQYFFYRHSSFTNYSSFAVTNTSNFEEGGIRDWDNPWFYGMDKYLISKVDINFSSKNYFLYENSKVILEETELKHTK